MSLRESQILRKLKSVLDRHRSVLNSFSDEESDEYCSAKNSSLSSFSTRQSSPTGSQFSMSSTRSQSSEGNSFSDEESEEYYSALSSPLSSSQSRQSSPAWSQLPGESMSSGMSSSSSSSKSSEGMSSTKEELQSEQSPNGKPIENVLNQCKKCKGPGCGFFVCACGDNGIRCLDCIEKSIRARDRLKQKQCDAEVCPQCWTKYDGIEITRGRTLSLEGMNRRVLTSLALSPLILCLVGAMVLLAQNYRLSTYWALLAGMLLFIYILECLVYLYYGDDLTIRGFRLTEEAIPIKESDIVQRVTRECLDKLSNLRGQIRELQGLE